jgi:hypothetical protein
LLNDADAWADAVCSLLVEDQERTRRYLSLRKGLVERGCEDGFGAGFP